MVTPLTDRELSDLRRVTVRKPTEYERRAYAAARDKWVAIADKLLAHCTLGGGECSECGRIICPHADPFHFHHDGCPSCSTDEARDER